VSTVRKLVFGETWTIPIGVGISLAVCGLLRLVAGDNGWWRDVGGFVLLAGVTVTLLVAVGRPRR
jgi:hypothetical protein